MRLLAFDTSGPHCAAALVGGGAVLAQRHEAMATGQAERLMPMLGEVLAEAGLGWGDLDGIGVGTGPGNFTGVRIAVAAARGLALGLGRPAVGVTTFEALARGLGACLVALDGRLGQAHLQAFGPGAFGPLAQPVLEPLPPLPPGTPVLGDLAATVAAASGLPVAEPAEPLAVAIAHLAAARIGPGARRPAPLYLRAADALPSRDAPPTILPG